MPLPLVSVVIPTHNRPEMLAEAIASVRAQTFADYEIIVVSNGESEEMRERSRACAFSYDARYFDLAEGNVSAARNFGINHANGEWIAFLDDDDLWLPNKLERQLAEADRTRADLISCDHIEFHPNCIITCQPRVPQGWSYVKAASWAKWWPQPGTVMVRKNAIKAAGGFDPKQRSGEELDAWRRISWHHSIQQMDEPLTHVRKGHESLTRNHLRMCFIYDLRHFFKMYLDTPKHLRSELPPAWFFLPFRIVIALSPRWLFRFRPLHRLRKLRDRLAAF